MNSSNSPAGIPSGERVAIESLLTKQQAADQLQVSVRMVERLVALRRIPVVKIGRHVRIEAAALAAYVASQTRPAVVAMHPQWGGR